MKPKEDYTPIIQEAITYFNKVSGCDYKAESKATIKVITARIKEGFSIEDFKLVIDSKNKEWIIGSNMRQYLRPTTLFNENKFESYLEYAKQNLKSNASSKMSGMIM